MKPGQIVLVDWRDALPGSGEPNKVRPAVIIGSERFFGSGLPFEIVVPLSGEPALAIDGASLAIEPAPDNGCVKRSYALAWNVQTVPHSRLQPTPSCVSASQLAQIRDFATCCIVSPQATTPGDADAPA